MTEHLKFMGRLEEKKLKAKNLKLQIEGFRDALRDKLDPFEPLVELQEESISTLAAEFTVKMISYREVLAEIKLIKKTLGKN